MGLCTYLDVLKLHTIGTVDDDTMLCIVYLHILDVDIAYRHLWETIEVSCTTGCAADDMVDVDIAEARCCLVYLELLYLLALSLIAIVENLNGRLATVVKVEGADPAPFQVDGDYAGTTPVNFTLGGLQISLVTPRQ